MFPQVSDPVRVLCQNEEFKNDTVYIQDQQLPC